MDIELFKKIIDSDLPQDLKEKHIIIILSKDKNVIPEMLKILGAERDLSEELIVNMNLELSRAQVYISERPEPKDEAKLSFNKNFIVHAINQFYIKYSSYVNHCFKK